MRSTLITAIFISFCLSINAQETQETQKAPEKQKMAFYTASMMPPPDDPEPHLVDRKKALAAGADLETPVQAHQRLSVNGDRPAHYIPTPSKGQTSGAKGAKSPYE